MTSESVTHPDFPAVRLRARLASGPHGVAYDGVEIDSGKKVLLHDLRGMRGNEAQLGRMRARVERSRRTRMSTAMVPSTVVLDGNRPHLVCADVRDWSTLAAAVLPTNAAAVRIILSMLDTLACAHRVGLVHGRLAPSQVFIVDGEVRLDFLALRTGKLTALADLDLAMPKNPLSVGLDADVFDAASIIHMIIGGAADSTVLANPGFGALLSRAHSVGGDDRIDMVEFAALAQEVLDGAATIDGGRQRGSVPVIRTPPQVSGGEVLFDRFVVRGDLGEGAIGQVKRAFDRVLGCEVALKVLVAGHGASSRQRLRFQKEARILSELQSPFLVGFKDAGMFQDQMFIAMELVAGRDAQAILDEKKRLSIAMAVAVVADVARGLAEAHRVGVVHRDIKPANILVIDETGCAPAGTVVARLVDFGISRHVDETASLAMTGDGSIIGTPLYMAPEQASADVIGPEADVYALAATLFHLVTGRPVFEGPGASVVLAQHLNDAPPRMDDVDREIPRALADVVARALDKRAAERPRDASLFLDELLRATAALPRAWGDDEAADERGVRTFTFTWDLKSSPRALWPLVSDTDRVNRAAGLAIVDVENRVVNDDVEQHAKMKAALGIEVAWREFPFEWIENQRFAVYRAYEKGPFVWFKSVVTLDANASGGTQLRQVISVRPRGLVGEAGARIEIGVRGKRALDDVYRRIDSLVDSIGAEDRFSERVTLSPSALDRLALVEDELVARGLDPKSVAALGDLLRTGNAKDVARIRPLAFARRGGFTGEMGTAVLLHAARLGAVELRWDLLCPSCKIASDMVTTLLALKVHGRCDACDLDYELDLARSVELVFSAHPSIRDASFGTYCASSPGHSPHIRARVRLKSGESMALALALDEGAYRITGRHVPTPFDFVVRDDAKTQRLDLSFQSPLPENMPRELTKKRQTLVLTNPTDRELVVRVESRAPRDDALTAAAVASNALFRKLFPGELLDGKSLMGASTVILAAVEFDGATIFTNASVDDADLASRLASFYVALDAHVSRHGGALVRVRDPGALLSFVDPSSAFAWAKDLDALLAETRALQVKLQVGVHIGGARLVTLNGRLDYFGALVHRANLLAAHAPPGQCFFSEAMILDPGVARFIDDAPHGGRIVTSPIGGLGITMPVMRL